MPEDASSSVNDNSVFITELTETLSAGDTQVKISLSDGRSFFTRLIYFNLDIGDFYSFFSQGSVFSEDMLNELYIAVRRYFAECKALDYLNRAEQSRFMLERKLSGKEFLTEEFSPALDFLQEKGYLDDSRFAASWLRARIRLKPEGKIKLKAGLYKKGISRQTAEAVLSDFFDDVDEADLCRRALQKQVGHNQCEQKLIRSMLRKGFSYSVIMQCLAENE